jgi:hypothetical protein
MTYVKPIILAKWEDRLPTRTVGQTTPGLDSEKVRWENKETEVRDPKPEENFVPARGSSFAPGPSVISGICSLVGSGTHTRLYRTELGERKTDTCEQGFIPDRRFANLSEKPPFYAALSLFDPGIGTYGIYGREEAS